MAYPGSRELNQPITDSNSNMEVLLQRDSFLYQKKKIKFSITLTECTFTCSTKQLNGGSSISYVYNISDIIGCDAMKGKTKEDKNAYLTLYAYPHKKKFGSKKTARKRETLTLVYDEHNSYDENMCEATKWKDVLIHLIKRLPVTSSNAVSTPVPPMKKMLVLVNPFSGPGKALSLFQQRVIPVLAEANIHYNLVVTERAGHAFDLVQSLKLEDWHGIIIVSGDGLVFEVVNGLMQRPDWKDAIHTPLGVLPGGSGNALAASLNYIAGEPYMDNHILHSSFMIAKHIVKPLDLVAVDTCDGKRSYSFLSVAWGIVADIDIESEKYRHLGPVRFTMGIFTRVVNLRKYPGKVSFLPVDKYEPKTRKQISRSQSEIVTHDNNPVTLTRANTVVGHDPFPEPEENSSGEGIRRNSAAVDNIDMYIDPDRRESKLPDLDKVEDAQVNGSDVTNAMDAPSREGDGDARPGPEVLTDLLPPLSDPVPDNWVKTEGEYVMFLAVYLSHLASNTFADPRIRLDDGVIHLALLKAGVTKLKLLDILGSLGAGEIVEDDHLEVIKVKAFRLEPLAEKGILTIDGENVAYGPVQAQVLPGLARVMTLEDKV